MNLSNKLTQLRKSKGLSQDDLAVKLNISRQAVYKWETGQSTPDIDNLKILSTIYNVSVDNLLNDNEELAYKDDNKKLSYGKPVVLGLPSSDSAETDNIRLYEKDAKKVKIRKIVTTASLSAFIAGLAIFLLLMIFPDMPSGLFTMLFVIFLLGLLIGFPVWFLSYKFLFKKVYEKSTYFRDMKAQKETVLQNKGYKYIALQSDLLQWFYYNPKDKTFGFYFDDKEQFICPIQNYVSYTYPEVESSEVRVGSQYNVGALVGSLSGVSVTREAKMAKSEQMTFVFTLKYCDEKGELKEYQFSLSTIREYTQKICDSVEEMQFRFNLISNSTKQAYNEIIELLNFEKSKIA